jgi:predicted TIM-barrel fold metal-dependent hydrolase
MTPSKELRFFDPHFHLWDMTPEKEEEGEDISTTTVSGHDNSSFPPNFPNLYGKAEYEAEIIGGGGGGGVSNYNDNVQVVHEGGVCIEVNSINFVDQSGEELISMYQKELNWTLKQFQTKGSSSSNKQNQDQDEDDGDCKLYMYQACASLEASNVKEWLEILSKIPTQVCGIRQIINYKPSWPRNDNLGELLNNDDWKRGYRLLGEYNLTFDMQLNPNQFESALELIKDTPNVYVIINHLGTPTIEDLTDEKRKQIYWDGIEEFSQCKHVIGIKISMLSRIDPKNWDTNPIVIEAIHRIIKLFGVQRVAFASNAPVDANNNDDDDMSLSWPASRVLAAFDKITASTYTTLERAWLFADAAKRMYHCS